MKKYVAGFALAGCLAIGYAYAITGSINVTVGPTTPGPNANLFAHPYYTCVRNFYVATNGNDSNPGTLASPWLTPDGNGHGNNRLAGDCLNFQNGTYTINPTGFTIAAGQGTSLPTGYFVIRAVNLNGAIFKSVTSNVQNDLVQIQSNYIIIDGLEVDGSHPDDTSTNVGAQYKCVSSFPDSEHFKVLNSKIHNCGGGGVVSANGAYSGDHIEIAYNDIYLTSLTSNFSESGISVYVPTRDDATLNNDDNLMPYQIWIHHNKMHNNHCNLPCQDGNGIIIDHAGDADKTHQTAQPNAGYTRSIGVTYNWAYLNGGRGITLTASNDVIIDHNSLYANARPSAIFGSCPIADIDMNSGQFLNSDPNGAVITNNAMYNPPLDCGGGVLTACIHWDGGPRPMKTITGNSTYNGTPGQNCVGQGSATPIMPTGQTPPNQIGVNPGYINLTPGSENLCIASSSAIFGLGIGSC